ncbi:MAG: sulfide/dihydroorotate dehydrogenase-like FAD/NAD-binding protein [Candidatus Delongbacteria bacterium]
MNKILRKRILSPGVKDLLVETPRIARKRQAGQFVMLRVSETGERIPLTIADADPEAGWIRLIFQEVGHSTLELGRLEVGDSILDLAGPLGRPTHVENKGTVVCVGGGIGTAPVHPIACAMKAAGNRVISILGARTAELLIMEEEMGATSDELLICTDDGSKGRQGFVTNVLQDLIERGETIHEVVAIGPVVMMRAVSEVTRAHGISTVVSLNATMVDGTGMCGGCRVTVNGRSRFVCVDGPEFDGHAVDFAELQQRQRAYLTQERQALEADHVCHIGRDQPFSGRSE